MFDKVLNKVDKKQPAEHTALRNRFSLKLSQDWEDCAYFKFDGPVEDGVNPNIFAVIDNNVKVPGLEQYGQLNIQGLEHEVKGY